MKEISTSNVNNVNKIPIAILSHWPVLVLISKKEKNIFIGAHRIYDIFECLINRMNKLKQYIADKNWVEVLNQCKVLNTDERSATIQYLHSLDIDLDILAMDGSSLDRQARSDFYVNRNLVASTLNFALIACTREFGDIAKIEYMNATWLFRPLNAYLAKPDIGVKPLLAFYQLFPPDYLDKIVKASQKERFGGIDFKLLWTFYKQDWINFDESYFVMSLFTVTMFDRNTQEEAEFLFKNPDVIGMVFLQFHKYEIPVLDISKWKAREGYVCKKVTEYWTEVIRIMQEKGYVFDRSIIPFYWNPCSTTGRSRI